jgi:hypothetical protein
MLKKKLDETIDDNSKETILLKEKKIPIFKRTAFWIVTTIIMTLAAFVSSGESTAGQEELNSTKAKLVTIEAQLEAVQQEYDDYKKKMEPYEKLSAAEAEAAILKAEQEKVAAEAAAAEIARQEAEEKAAVESARLAEEAKGYETGITYDQIARTPDDYIGKKVKFKGEVVQVIEGNNATQMRLAVNNDYDKMVFIEMPKALTENNRVLENDEITIYGHSVGLYSYQSTLGGNITVPGIIVDRFE